MIVLEDGKYGIQNDNGILTFYRYGEFWPGSEDLKGAGVVLALVHEVERLRGLLTGEREFPVEVFSPGDYAIGLKDGKVSFRKNVNAF